MKRLTSLILALLLLLSLAGGAFASGEPETAAEEVPAEEEPEAELPAEKAEQEEMPAEKTAEELPAAEEIPADEQPETVTADGAVIANGTCGDNLTWNLDEDGVLTISGTGDMYTYDNWKTYIPWYDYRDAITEAVVEDGVTGLSCWSFSYCTNLTEASLPDGLITIGGGAFENTGLIEISVPDSVTSLGSGVFEDCSSLKEISLGSCGITSIPICTFGGCSSLTEVIVPDGVTLIDIDAFFSCSSLTEVSLPDGLTTIEHDAFYCCSSLEEICIPDSVTSIGYDAFGNCSSLTEVTVPAGVEEISTAAFSGCTALEQVTLTAGVRSIGMHAFGNCPALTEIVIPAGVTSISDSAFHNCTGLTDLYIYNADCELGHICHSTAATWSGAEIISREYALTASPTIHGYAGSTAEAFAMANGLTFEALDGTHTQPTPADNFIISAPTAKQPDTTPASMVNVSRTDGSKDGGEITVTYDTDNLGSIQVSYDNGESWQQAYYEYTEQHITIELDSVPCTIAIFTFIPDEDCGDDVTWNLDENGVLTISGTGDMWDFGTEDHVVPDFSHGYSGSAITTAIIDNGVTAIGDYAFSGCINLTDVTIPDSVTRLGRGAFSSCTGLTDVTIPDSVTELGDYAFCYCTNLTDITIPNSVTAIGYGAFESCSSLKAVTIPNSVTEIDGKAFADTGLTKVSIPASVQAINNSAFADCSALTDLYIYNPDCKLELICHSYREEYDQNTGHIISEGYVLTASPTIHGYAGSTAEAFAMANGLTFVDLSTEPQTAAGDLSGDGKINVIDALKLFRAVNGQTEALSPEEADLNGDGKVNVVDALKLFRFVNGQIDTL